MNAKTRACVDKANRVAGSIKDSDQKNLALVLVQCASAICEEISANVGSIPLTLSRFEREFAASVQST